PGADVGLRAPAAGGVGRDAAGPRRARAWEPASSRPSSASVATCRQGLRLPAAGHAAQPRPARTRMSYGDWPDASGN
ncbi:hypothetical protein, partial [[Mycobacterium] manitobense]|uniref:hypothetical protein n=1 Tax=[Mycobacterium] manitobense TaxID=190147 RepID=UPI0021F27F5D